MSDQAWVNLLSTQLFDLPVRELCLALLRSPSAMKAAPPLVRYERIWEDACNTFDLPGFYT